MNIKKYKHLFYNKNNKKIFELAILITISSIFISFTIYLNFLYHIDQTFTQLSISFLNGRVSLMDGLKGLPKPENITDIIFFNGKYFWPEGPFPAILLLPFVFIASFFNIVFYQGYLQPFLVIIIAYLIFKIAKKIFYFTIDSWYISYAFCFSTMFIGIALLNVVWYFSQVITVLLLFFALFEYFHKKRYWIIGIIFGLLMLTRITAAVGIVFFVLEILLSKDNNKANKLWQLVSPFMLVSLLLPIYNYIRFNNIFEQGYSLCALGALNDTANNPLVKAREYGMINIIHIPGNLFYSLISMPVPIFRDSISHVLKFPFLKPDPWGMSIFVTSPYLLYLFFLKQKDKISWILLITVFLIAMPIFLYYGIGFLQLGYRYALDFMPFLFLLFLLNYRNKYNRLSAGLKTVIVLSSFINLFFFLLLFK